jgi:iron complex outermembrane recepter protein
VLVLVLGLLAGALHAELYADEARPVADPAIREPAVDGGRRAAIAGTVRDQASGAPLAVAAVVLVEAHQSALTSEDGTFRFADLAPGTYTVRISRVGYKETEVVLALAAGEERPLAVVLAARIRTLDPVTVEGEGGAGESKADKPVQLSGAELDAELGRTLADTIDDAPGLAQRSMGPAPARPVLRGLGGNRLLILEDGDPTGDLSATAPDHAVVIDPITSHEVEVVRGPASVRYGSSTLAGVINVERGYAPDRLPASLQGTAAVQGESVNRGGSGSGELAIPLGPLALRADGSVRRAGDILTPAGTLHNTPIDVWSTSIGGSWFRPRGHMGVAFSLYDAEYGVPGGFLGGHPNGVDIEADRRHFEAMGERALGSGTSFLERLEVRGAHSRYFHRELESSGVCGVSFGLLTTTGSALLRFRGPGGSRGFAGFDAEHRDYANGCLSFIPPTTERTLAGFAYDEVEVGRFRFAGSLRMDDRAVEPAEPDSNKAGLIRRRSFGGVSGGFMVSGHITPTWGASASIMRSFHPPAIEELFSDGPHLAAYSYEVGNADLDAETGTGLEFGIQHAGERRRIEATVFRNAFPGYIFPTNTGELEYGPGETGVLARYQFAGRDAIMTGVELALEWDLTSALTVGGAMAAVRGQLEDGAGEPLPSMPPLQGNLFARLERGSWAFQGRLRMADEQDRVGEFEEPTAGYAVLDARISYRLIRPSSVQGVVLSIENLTDAEYRNHLSRLRSIMPEPGINMRLFYRMTFGGGGL